MCAIAITRFVVFRTRRRFMLGRPLCIFGFCRTHSRWSNSRIVSYIPDAKCRLILAGPVVFNWELDLRKGLLLRGVHTCLIYTWEGAWLCRSLFGVLLRSVELETIVRLKRSTCICTWDGIEWSILLFWKAIRIRQWRTWTWTTVGCPLGLASVCRR